VSYVLPAVRDLLGQHPRAAGCTPEVVAGLLWILCFIPEPVEPFEVATCLEVLDIERERQHNHDHSLTKDTASSEGGRSVT
jgi:hypothetical protein